MSARHPDVNDSAFDFDVTWPNRTDTAPTTGACFTGPSPARDGETGIRNIRIMGDAQVDGAPVRSYRPLEFVTALGLAGGAMSKEGLERRLFADIASTSAVPTQCYRARQLGFDISYESASRRYLLHSAVRIDALRIIRLFKAGDARAALCLWSGQCLASSTSPLANSIRTQLEIALVDAVTASNDSRLTQTAMRVTDSSLLASHCDVGVDDPFAQILSDSRKKGDAA